MHVRLARSMLCLFALLAACAPGIPAVAQTDPTRTPLPAPVKVKQGVANVPALSPLWLLPAEAAKYNVQVEQVLFQRFADARTALAAGDLDIAAFGPQDITLGLGQGAKSMIGVAGIGSGNDCLLVRKGDDIKEWTGVGAKTIGVGAGSISWLKFAASVQENGLDYGKLRIVNIMGAAATISRLSRARRSIWPWSGTPSAPRASWRAGRSIRRSPITSPRPWAGSSPCSP